MAASAPAKAAGGVKKTGYQGFGSFHSDNVEVLIRQPDSEYAPAPPFRDPTEGLQLPALLGEAARRLWLIDFEGWTFINHGAFGATAAPVQEAADAWRRHCERQPLQFIDRELFPQMVRVLRQVAAFVNCRPQDVVLLPNATTGLNTIISSIKLAPGDSVYQLEVGYGSVKKMLAVAAQQAGAAVVTGALRFPISGPEDVLAAVAASLPASGCKLAVFDAVTSNTALVLPTQELARLCRSRGIPVLIDGAHALGQLPVDLQALGADFFVSNCHKWLCGARGSALMYVAPDRQPSVRPLVLSHGSGAGFTSDFIWDGCRDYAPLLAVGTALRLHQLLGPGRLRAYMHDLLQQACGVLVGAWGTDTLAPLTMCASMALVRLPDGAAAGADAPGAAGAGGGAAQPPASTSADAKYVQDRLHFAHRIEVPVKCIQGRLYVRVSAAPYNHIGDYRRLADAVLGWAAGGQPAAAGQGAGGSGLA